MRHPITVAAKSDRKPDSEEEMPGVPSPDGRLLARVGDDGLEILEFQSQKVTKTIKVREESNRSRGLRIRAASPLLQPDTEKAPRFSITMRLLFMGFSHRHPTHRSS